MKCPNCKVDLTLHINETPAPTPEITAKWQDRLTSWGLLLSTVGNVQMLDSLAKSIGLELEGSDAPPSVRAKVREMGQAARARISSAVKLT